MIVRVNRKFLKDLALLPLKERKRIEEIVFEISPNCNSCAEIPGASKLKGYSHYYKIRIGNYRIGLRCKPDELVFERVLHRKEIYRYYP